MEFYDRLNMKEEIVKVGIAELIKEKDENEKKMTALLRNPLLNNIECAKLRYVIDDNPAGSVNTIPLQITAHGQTFDVCAGSTLKVVPEYRGRGIAQKLTLERITLSKDRIAIASGMSNMSLPLFQKLGFTTFVYPRLIFINHSRAVVDAFLHGFLQRIVSAACDFCINIYKRMLYVCSIWNNKRIQIQEVVDDFSELGKIVEEDSHAFKEKHNEEWFRWVSKHSFSDDERSEQHVYLVKQNGVAQAFFMTKIRFYEKASHRGFNNVLLGSVIEWGIKANSSIKESQVCMAALLSFKKEVDAIELCTPDKKLRKYLKWRGVAQVGNSNFAIKAAPDSPLHKYDNELSDIENWRIRPAMSDNGLS